MTQEHAVLVLEGAYISEGVTEVKGWTAAVKERLCTVLFRSKSQGWLGTGKRNDLDQDVSSNIYKIGEHCLIPYIFTVLVFGHSFSTFLYSNFVF